MRLQLRRILTAPFRLLTWPFRALRNFLNFEPDDTPTTEVFARTLSNPSVLIEHLEALRRHVLRSLAVLYLGLELFLFLQPGLRPRERKFLLLAIPSAGVLLLAGMAFAFFVMLP